MGCGRTVMNRKLYIIIIFWDIVKNLASQFNSAHMYNANNCFYSHAEINSTLLTETCGG